MLKSYKTEIKPTVEQKNKIKRTIGVCRFVYNLYISYNQEQYEQGNRFVSGKDFSKYLNNVFLPNNPDYKWIREVSSKSVKQAIMNGDKAYRNFFKGLSDKPKLKKKRKQTVKMYLPKNSKTDFVVERHKIKVPTLKYIRIKEKGYIPTNSKVTSATLSQKADRFYISVLVNENKKETKKEQEFNSKPYSAGIGIDLGIKDLAIVSRIDKPFGNINKTKEVKRLEKRLKREQRCLSRKYEARKKKGNKTITSFSNINKQIIKVQIIHQSIYNIRTDYINKVVFAVVKTKPRFITIENLNVRGMMKNRHLSKAIAGQKWYEFKTKLKNKCKKHKIELRLVSSFFPSTKKCSGCDNIKQDLTLKDRVYICACCGLVICRDKNSSVNLERADKYEIIA